MLFCLSCLALLQKLAKATKRPRNKQSDLIDLLAVQIRLTATKTNNTQNYDINGINRKRIYYRGASLQS